MKIKFLTATFSFLYLVLFVQAQDSTSVSKSGYKKNEFSTSISSIRSMFTNGTSSNNNSTLYFSYKRALNKIKLRSSLYLQTEEFTEQTPYQLVLTDSSFIYMNKSYVNTDFNFKIGLQNNQKARKLQFSYGADLLIGMQKNEIKYLSNNYILEGDVLTKVKDDDSLHISTDYIEQNTKEEYINLGIAPVFGIDYVLIKNFSFGFFISTDLYYKIITTDDSKNSSIDFHPHYEIVLTLRL